MGVESDYKSFGEVFNQILKEKGMSIYRLSQLTGISTTHLYRLQNNKSEPSFYILKKISDALSINLDDYYKIYSDFNSIKEYNSFIELRYIIENEDMYDIRKIEDIVENINSDEVKNTLFMQLVLYAKAVVKTSNKNYKNSLKLCYEALGTIEKLFNVEKFDKYLKYETSFNIIQLIEYNYFQLNDKNKALIIGENLYNYIEKKYFSENIIKMPISKKVFRAYVSTINNIADTLFELKDYETSIYYCEKGIEFLKRENSIYNLSYLYEVLMQNYYLKLDIEKAVECYEKANAVCFLNEDNEHLERINKRVKEKYCEIWRIRNENCKTIRI